MDYFGLSQARDQYLICEDFEGFTSIPAIKYFKLIRRIFSSNNSFDILIAKHSKESKIREIRNLYCSSLSVNCAENVVSRLGGQEEEKDGRT